MERLLESVVKGLSGKAGEAADKEAAED